MNFKLVKRPVAVTLISTISNWSLIKIGLERYGVNNLQLSNYLFLGTLVIASVIGTCHQKRIKK